MKGVCGVHDLHVWSIGSGREVLSAHLVMGGGSEPGDYPRVLDEARLLMESRFGIRHSTIQVETAQSQMCPPSGCPAASLPEPPSGGHGDGRA